MAGGLPGIPRLGGVVDAAMGQVVALVRLPTTALGAAEELREAARAMRRVAERVDGVLDEIEDPVRALAPTLARLSRLLDDPLVAEAPETLLRLRDELLPALRGSAAAMLMRRANRPPQFPSAP